MPDWDKGASVGMVPDRALAARVGRTALIGSTD